MKKSQNAMLPFYVVLFLIGILLLGFAFYGADFLSDLWAMVLHIASLKYVILRVVIGVAGIILVIFGLLQLGRWIEKKDREKKNMQ